MADVSKVRTFEPNMEKIRYLFLFYSVLLSFSSCQYIQKQVGGKPYVEVAGHYLYYEDLANIVPMGITGEDSVQIIERFVQRWATDILVYEKAKQNVAKNEEIERLVDAYRKSLIMHEYEQRLVGERLSKEISEQETMQFYNQYASSLKLTDELLQGILIAVPNEAPHLNNLKKWMNNPDSVNIEKIEKYALQNASNYQFFMDEWKTFADIQKSLVKPVQHPSQLLSTAGSTIVMNDSVTTNILYIKQFLLTGQQKPYEYAKEEIKEILLNRRKIEFLQQLETAIYNDALQGGEIIYYQ